ncbi:MAG: DUF928 domain-containing protein [Nostoc sp.]|uniref:DUF928 domain-containing protein n=1 Tax=Nostoc sp. TaxID=1180 RepID=UPI002FFA04F6
MIVNNPSSQFKFFLLGLILQSLMFALPSLAQSESVISKVNLLKQFVFQETFEPPGEPKPKSETVGAGSRDGLRCSENEQPIKPLMPKHNFGLTFQDHPPVFISLPKTSAQKVVLTFKDETGNYYERTFLPITTNGGIVSFTQPKDKTPLTVGKNYEWSLVVVCGKTVQPDDPTFKGWVQRVAKTTKVDKELSQLTTISQANWYAQRGYWYEMLMTIEKANKADPNNNQLK